MASLTPETAPAAIDQPGMRHAGRALLSLALMDARNHTLHLLGLIDDTLRAQGVQVPEQPGMELPAWLGGHIAWLAEYWIGRNPQRHLGSSCPPGAMRLASIEPMADQWFNPALASHSARWRLPLPDLAMVRSYLLETLESTLELLERAHEGDEGLYFFRAALFHEDLRGEQLAAIAQALGVPLQLPLPAGPAPREALLVPGARHRLGSEAGGFVPDLERWAHSVDVPEFEIDAQPVNWSQFVEFVDDGGYDRPELWHADGWKWLEREAGGEGRRGPRYVEQIGVASGAVLQTHFGKPTRMAGSQSAMHLTWWEADAWARWAGRRLPTEVEWELAALTAGRRGFRWGELREWTAGTLRPYPGFFPDAWTLGGDLDAQQAFGQARVLRGGSFATRARMKLPKMRAFALPERDEGFTGFRSCAL